MDIDKEIKEVVLNLREAAREEVLPRFGRISSVVKTGFRDFQEIVTEADIKAGERILESVRRRVPGSYSEEQLHEDRFDQGVVWQFDPVDGTQEFCEGMKDGYAMHGALLKKQTSGLYFPVAGIIYLPGVDKLWFTDSQGKLHFIEAGKEKEISESDRSEIRGYVRKVDPNEKVERFYERLGKKMGLNVRTVLGGGSGASISDLLEGKINLIVMNYDYTKEWDLAMAEPMIKARGGFICDLDGKEFNYNRRNPFNKKGYVISIAFKKEEILPEIQDDLLIRKL